LDPDRPIEVRFEGQAAELEVDWGPTARAPRSASLGPSGPERFEVDPAGRFADPLAAPRPAEDAVVKLRLLDPDGALLDEQPVFFQRAPSLLPDFPVELNDGVRAAPRVDDRGRIWVATTSGRLVRVSPRGEVEGFELVAGISAAISFDAEERPWVVDETGQVWRLSSTGLEAVFEAGADAGPAVHLFRDGEGEVWVRSPGRLSGGRPPGVVTGLPGRGAVSAFRDEMFVGTSEGLVRFVPSSGERRTLFDGLAVDWLVTGLDEGRGLALGRASGLLGELETDLFRFDLEAGEPEALDLGLARLQAGFAVTSVDRAGGQDVVGFGFDGATLAPYLYAFDLRREEMVEGFPVPLAFAPEAPVLPLDLDGDARAELIHAAQPFGLMAVGRAGTGVRSFPRLTGDEVQTSPAAGDVDGDGQADLVAVTRSGRVFAWRGRGRPPTQWTGAHRDDGATLDLRNELSGQPRETGGCRSSPISPWLLLLVLAVPRARAGASLRA
jgi:hypothetical protein